MRKPFSQSLHDTHNAPAIVCLIWNYLGQGWVHNPDPYGPDILHVPTQAFAEVEIKYAWRTGKEFPFPTVNLPERKAKWKNMNICFFILNHQLTHAIKILPHCLREEFLKEVPNKYVAKQEYFFQIPLELTEIIHWR